MGYKFKIPRVFGKNLIAGLAVPLLAALRAGLIKLAIWAALLGTTTVTLAFEGYEHRQIGDAAFFVALSYMTREWPDKENFNTEKYKAYYADFCTLLAPAYRNDIVGCKSIEYANTLTYGELAACIDHFKGGPERLISPLANIPSSSILANISSSSQDRANYLASEIGKECRNERAAISSARSNDAHFQGEAIKAFELAHIAARGIFRERGDIYLAAVINAGADHYLLDLLAPGHVYVRRANLADGSALSAHDLANRDGGTFHIALKNDQSNKVFKNLRKSVCDDKRVDLIRGVRVLFRNIDNWHGKGVFDADELADACSQLASLMLKPVDITFRGDDFIFEKKASAQRLYAVLLQAQSVVDVLNEDNDTDSFKEIRLNIDCASPQCKKDKLVLTFDGVSGFLSPQHDWGFLDVVTLNTDALKAENNPYRANTYRAGSRSVMLGLSVEGSATVSDSGLGRGSQVVELWMPVARNPNSWFVAGYVQQWEPSKIISLSAYGMELRYAVGTEVLPGFTFAPFYRNVLYDGVERSVVGRVRLQRVGLRVDIGATDLIGAYLSVYNDFTYSHSRFTGEKISDEKPGVSGGLTIRVPFARAWRCVETFPRCIGSFF